VGDSQILRVGMLEDDVDQANRASGWISERGHHCEVFNKPDDFQRAFRKTSYDVVTLDWNLPEATGLEILKWIRQSLVSDVPVIFITARQGESDIVAALEAGADDYLVKPVRQFELLARIGALARRAQPETEILEYESSETNRERVRPGFVSIPQSRACFVAAAPAYLCMGYIGRTEYPHR